MTTSIVKKYRFEAAHRLGLGYKGKCADLHGHSYKVFIEIQAYQLDKFGMVVDFGELKPLKDGIMNMFDHKTILHKDDEELIAFLRANQGNDSVYTTEENPTCETLAKEIFELTQLVLALIFPKGQLKDTRIDGCDVGFMAPKVVSVTVQETESGLATVRDML